MSVIDLGIVRAIADDKVTITPTYSGCPATDVIERTIREALDANGYRDVAIETVLTPPWTTDWISEEGKEQASRLWHRAARAGQGRHLPAMRINRYRGSQPLRLDPLQGAMALQGLPGTVRPVQVSLNQFRILSALPPVQQLVVGQHERNHRLDHRRAANSDAGVVTSFANADTRRRLEGDANDDRLAGRNASVDAAGLLCIHAFAAAERAAAKTPRRSRRL